MQSEIPFADARRTAVALTVLISLLATLALSASTGPTVQAQAFTADQVNDQLGLGVNLGNALEGPREGVWGLTLQEDHFSTIAAAGFGHVRVPIRFSAYADPAAPFTIPEGVDPSIPNADNVWERIDWVIANAVENDLYVILDLHHYGELFDDVAGERDRFLAIWQQIAERYADADALVLFELLNEPHGQFNDDPALLNSLLADALDVVRASNPMRPVLVGPVWWNSIGALDSLELPDDDNLIVSLHFYEPFAFTHQGATWLDPVPAAPAVFEAGLVDYAALWGSWSWDTEVVASEQGLRVSYGNQWAGLGFGRTGTVDPATMTVTIAGDAELRVGCASADDIDAETDTEVGRIVTTDSSTEFEIDMTACPSDTQLISLMAASIETDELLVSAAELCDGAGVCRNMVETGAQAIGSAFDVARDWGLTNDRPINIGEFGSYSAEGVADLGQRAEWTEIVRRAGQNRGFSMTYWEFGAGFGVYDQATSSWVEPLIDALGVEASSVVIGDVTADDITDTADVQAVLDWLAGGEEPVDLIAGDLNANDAVALDDALVLAQLVAG